MKFTDVLEALNQKAVFKYQVGDIVRVYFRGDTNVRITKINASIPQKKDKGYEGVKLDDNFEPESKAVFRFLESDIIRLLKKGE
jgi:hypothetical protein